MLLYNQQTILTLRMEVLMGAIIKIMACDCVVQQIDCIIMEECTASIFRMEVVP
jgi:hypothetical protein